jgi:myo-inositol-1(or 4)-monophosphatase
MNTLDNYFQVCEEAARVGGQVVQDWLGRTSVREKGPADLVTQADLSAQEAVRNIVLGAFPGHSLLGEESLPDDPATVRAEYRWIVDPLDGTTNFVHGVPHYCTSLALERNGELLVGAIYDPNTDECFTAATGRGAFLNGRPIHVSKATTLSQALAAVGFPPNLRPDAPDLLVFLEMIFRAQAIRRTGSSALNLCYLAAGRYDLYWSYGTKVWDVAAGVLIVQEAGGTVTSPTGGPFVLDEARFLATSTPELHAELLAMVTKAVPGAS